MKKLGLIIVLLQLLAVTEVNAQCNAFFQYTLGACPDVSFFDGSTSSPGTINSWTYNFGDGGTSTQQNPLHTYTANGTYVVCLTIMTTDFCTSTYCDTVVVNCLTPPGCNAFFQYTLGACPDVSFFDGSTSSPGTVNSWTYNFGDGGTSTQQNPLHTYTANGTYVVCLTIVTSDFCTSTYCDTIVVNCITPPGCSAFFQYTLGACPDVSFFDGSTSSPGSVISWTYNFGDGGSSAQQNPTHTYTANGTYVVCLSIVTSDFCTSTYCDTIIVNCITPPGCSALFQYTLGACPDVSFFDGSTSSPGSVISWTYNFGDGGSSAQQNPTHTYTANGTYVVCLSIVTSDSCTSTYCDTIAIGCITPPGCNAFFQYTLGACPDVSFFDGSTSSPGTVTSWTYDFGDGGISSLQNPVHTYTANGTYVVCLSIVTSSFCTSTYCDTIVVGCITPPGCNAFFQYTLGACPDVSFFDGSTSSPGTVASWTYDFGDGGTSSLQNPVHTYTANGTYVVCLSIVTSDSCTSTFCDTMVINCISASSCNAMFTLSMLGCPDVFFVDASTASPGSVLSWNYDFGDGGTSTQQNPTHTYTANGMYVACLTIVTSDSCTSTFCDTITIGCITAPPIGCTAAFVYTLGGCPNISFFDASTSSPGTVTSWSYDFGDGGTSTQQNPVHTYTANGTYVACLSIVTSDSCTSTSCDTIVINCISVSSCNALFTLNMVGCPDVMFIDASTASPGSVVSWMYDFGDGNTSTQQNPIHTYNANGTYVACLTITTSDSCTSTFCDTIVINCIVGMQNLEQKNIRLQPNPAQDEFSVVLDNSSAINYRIITYAGVLVDEGTHAPAVEHSFDISSLVRGAYLLEIDINGVRNVLRFIKQ